MPKNFFEAIKHEKKDEWKKAMDEEIKAHIKNGTYELVPLASLPTGRKPIGSTWTYAIKRDSQGNITRYKARMCAQGFSQQEGFDYYATFANTVRFDTIRVALAYAAEKGYDLHTLARHSNCLPQRKK